MSQYILSREIAYNKLERMAYEIQERNATEPEIILVGIKENGVIIARIIHGFLQKIFKGNIEIFELSIDKRLPKKISLDGERTFDNSVIILIDDVSNSGRTLLYALRPFLDFYPKKIQTLVLLERSYKQFPVSPDYVGMSIATALSEKIVVETVGAEVSGARLE